MNGWWLKNSNLTVIQELVEVNARFIHDHDDQQTIVLRKDAPFHEAMKLSKEETILKKTA